MAQLHSRRQKDANFIDSTPIHTTSAVSASFDLEQVTGGLIEGLLVEIVSPADVATTGKICTYTLHDSADNSSFAAVDPKVSTTITAADSVLGAKTVEFPIPPNTRRYIRIAQTGDTLGASLAQSFTVSLLF
jgi:hypothetical protein